MRFSARKILPFVLGTVLLSTSAAPSFAQEVVVNPGDSITYDTPTTTITSLIQNGGSLTVSSSGGQTLFINGGSYTQNGGTAILTGEDGQGLYINATTAGFLQGAGAVLTATGTGTTTDGEGLRVSFTNHKFESSGIINATGTGAGDKGYGIYIDATAGRFIHAGGKITALGVNAQGYGIYYTDTVGQFEQNRGELNATGQNGGTGLFIGPNSAASPLDATNLIQGGSITALGQGGGTGIFLDRGTYNYHAGALSSTGDGASSYGIHLNSGKFVQTGAGLILATGKNGGTGIALDTGNFNQTTGTMSATGTGADSYGISLTSGNFTQQGDVNASGVSGGYGINTGTGNYIVSRGTLKVLGSGTGLNTGGNLQHNAGTIVIDPHAKIKVAGNASFGAGAVLRPGVDFSDKTIGMIDVSGTASVNPSATLDAWFKNTSALGPNESYNGVFLIAQHGSNVGTFKPPPSMTLDYELKLDTTSALGFDWHTLVITRSNTPGSLLEGNNLRATDALNNFLTTVGSDPRYDGLHDAHTILDLSGSQEELEKNARKLHPHATTRFAHMSIKHMDMVQNNLSFSLGETERNRTGTGPVPASQQNATPAAGDESSIDSSNTLQGWDLWLAPLAQYGKYDHRTHSFTDDDFSSVGTAIGLKRAFNGGVIGISAHYLNGHLAAGPGNKADSNTVGLLAGLRTSAIPVNECFTPWTEAIGGYSYSLFDQKRNDILDQEHGSDINLHTARLAFSMGQDFYPVPALRIAPILGADYSYIYQQGYNEDNQDNGLALTVGSKGISSLRPKAGLEAEFAATEKLNINADAFYKYETLDTQTSFTTRYATIPELGFITKSQEMERGSAAMDVGLTYKTAEDVSFSAGYGLDLSEDFQNHNVNVLMNLEF